MERIPVSGPWITQKEIDYVTDAVTNAWYGNANVYNNRFEEAFARYLGAPFAVSLPSCTSAIHLSLLALGVGPGDEVIVPDVTWIASAAPISYVGATPVFADIDPRTWCLTAQSLADRVGPRTKAVIPVDLYGNLADMDAVLETAQRHGIQVIEDAAEAIGSEYKGKKAGSFGATGVFSFHGTKTLTTGEGGMLVTSREDVYRRVLFLRDHGHPLGARTFLHAEVAYKYKMSCMQAALGLGQLERIDELVSHKRRIFALYERELAGVEGITLNYEAPEVKNTYWMVSVILDPRFGIGKERLIGLMSDQGVDCRPFFYPLSSIPAYKDTAEAARARERNIVSYAVSPWGVNLPSGMNMDEEKIVYVCGVLKRILASV